MSKEVHHLRAREQENWPSTLSQAALGELAEAVLECSSRK